MSRILDLSRLSALSVLAGLLAVFSGCSEEVTPADGIDAYYTLWGGFNPMADEQLVRIIPVTRTIGLGSADPLPITVTSLDLETNLETVWADTVVAFPNGSIGHIYRAQFRPAFGSRHLFRVVQADSRETTALVTVPELVSPIRQTTETIFSVVFPILWPDAPRLNQVRARYTLADGTGGTTVLDNPLAAADGGPVEFGWLTRLDLITQAADLRARMDFRPFAVCKIQLFAEVASEDWRPPGGVFDAAILVEPGTLSNVSNGFGFIGSAYPLSIEWSPTPDELSRANLQPRTVGCS